ncbi:hypothetical protein GCM10017620_06470 [Brevundimonas intermedia]|uniref:ATP-grasp domain-containing protein n=1 Tax=Brevundimonas intermedia TaxID=74315 RepID=A0ABQ5T4I7_9CAUL|nr:hypothetical protein GCM10017620_06470 [Brevundimonas intermedia]
MPADTLLVDEAAAMGVRNDRFLWGGAAPFAHVATKAISHGLPWLGARAPAGWNSALGDALGDAVLTGVTAFDPDEALAAGRALLQFGPVRVKQVRATGGRGQTVVTAPDTLEAALRDQPDGQIAAFGIVLEENLTDVETYSVGTTVLGSHRIAYWGLQRLARLHDGEEVYAGSDLDVALGGYEDLLAFDLPLKARAAVEMARRYDRETFAAYPGLFASRRNYDVIIGKDRNGATRTGVLEQSWRIGGASGAEMAALEALVRDRTPRLVRSFTMEVRDEAAEIPPGATLYYQGVDPVAGPMTKYAGLRP